MKISQSAISHTSAIYSIALFCLVANWCMITDGMTMWKFRFIKYRIFVDHLKATLLKLAMISLVFGSIMYYFFKNKRYLMFFFWPGLIVGNLLIYLSSQYIWVTGYEHIIQGWFILGHILICMCSGALLPCLIDFGVSHVPDNIDHDQAVSIYTGAIFFDFILGYLYSWHALIDYNKAYKLDYFPLSPIILSAVGFVLVIVEGLLYQFVFKSSENEKDKNVDEDSAPKKAKLLTVIKKTNTSTLLIVNLCLLVFYFLKFIYINYWLGFVKMVVPYVGGIVYTEDMLYEQYLYSLLFACIIIKIVLFRNGLTWPLTTFGLGMVLFGFTIYFSTQVTNQIRFKHKHRLVYPNNKDTKIIFVNLLHKDLSYYRGLWEPFLFTLRRMEGHFLVRRKKHDLYINDLSRYNCYSDFAEKDKDENFCIKDKSTFLYPYSESNVYESPLTFGAVTYNPDMSNTYIRDYTAREYMFHKSTLLAYACFIYAPFKTQPSRIKIIVTSVDRTTRYVFSFWTCRFMLPGKYEINIDNKPTLHLDAYYIEAGGSYFFLASIPDKRLNYLNQIYPNATVATYLVWNKPIAHSIICLLPQFIMLAFSEVLLFTGSIGYIYTSMPHVKSHILLLALLFGVGSFAFMAQLGNPSVIFSIFRNAYKFLIFGFLIFGGFAAIKLYQSFPGFQRFVIAIAMTFKNFMIWMFDWFKRRISGPIFKMFLKLIARDFEKSLKLGMFLVDDPDDDDVDRPRERRQDSEDEKRRRKRKAEDEEEANRRRQHDEDEENKKKAESEKKAPVDVKPQVAYESPYARGVHGKSKLQKAAGKGKASSSKKGGDKLHNPTYGEDFLDNVEK